MLYDVQTVEHTLLTNENNITGKEIINIFIASVEC